MKFLLRWSQGPLTPAGWHRSSTSYRHSLLSRLGDLWLRFSSVAQSCPILCDPMDCSTLGLPAHHQLLEFTQAYVYWVGDAIQPSHPVLSPSPPALNLSQYQGLFQWVSSSHQVAKVLEFQLQHQAFQWLQVRAIASSLLLWGCG